MKALSVFRPRIAPKVGGCLDEVIDRAVLDTAIDFTTRSLSLRKMMDPFTTSPGRMEYDLDPAVKMIVRAWCDGIEITPLDDDGMGAFGFVKSIPGVSGATGVPKFFAQTDYGVISLFPTPDSVCTINMRVAVSPSRSAKVVDDQLWEDNVEVIVDGALGRLFMEPGEWMSETLAKFHGTRYEAGVNAAMVDASRGSARAQQRVIPVHI